MLDEIVSGGNLLTGAVVGAGALIAWPLIGSMARPIAKSLIKAGIVACGQAEQV